MKRPPFLCLLMAAFAFSHLSASPYLETFRTLSKEKDTSRIEAFLKESETNERENPDFYATASNYWWNASRRVAITTQPSKEGEFSVRDPKTGEEVGSIARGTPDPKHVRKAIALLEDGSKRFPRRVDLALGLASLQRESDQPDAFTATLLTLLETAQKDRASLLWTENQPLPTPPDQFIPSAVQAYTTQLFQMETKDADKLCRQLLTKVIETFPDHPYAYNLQAALVAADGQPEEAIRLFKIVCAKNPDDALIHFNLAHLYRQQGQNHDAETVLRQIRDNPKMGQAAQNEAKAALEAAPATTPAESPQ